MKKIGKVLPLLLAMPLITGCGGKVKAPKFADAGSEVKADKFKEAFDKAAATCDYGKSEKVGSFEAKGKTSSTSTKTTTRGKKVVDSTEDYVQSASLTRYDAKNYLVRMTQDEQSKNVEKDPRKTRTIISSSSYEQGYQEGQYEGAKYLFFVNKMTKEFEPDRDLDDKNPLADVVDEVAKEEALYDAAEMFDTVDKYAGLLEKEQKKYAFYQKNNVFTIEYKDEVKDEEIKDEDKVKYVKSYSCTKKMQLDFTDDNVSYKFFEETKTTKNYKLAVNGFAANDIYEEYYARTEEATVKPKNVKLKAVDTKKFTAVGFEKE